MTKIIQALKKYYNPEKPWSQRHKNGNRLELIKYLRAFLDLLSGNEFTNLIKDIIRPNEMKEVASKYYQGLRNLSKPINKVKQKNKHYFYHQLKLAKFTLRELNEMDYKISEVLWSSCKKTHERLHGGRNRLLPRQQLDLIEIMEANSSISSYRTVKYRLRPDSKPRSKFEARKKELKLIEKRETEIINYNVSFCNLPIQEVKDKLDHNYDNLIDKSNVKKFSLSSMYKYVNELKVFKKSHNVSEETCRIIFCKYHFYIIK